MYTCKYCNKTFETSQKLSGHTTYCELNPNRNNNLKKLENNRKYIDYKNIHNIIYKCQYCNKEVGNNGCLVLHEKKCIKNPNNILSDKRKEFLIKKNKPKEKRKLTEEHKQKIRESYHKWMEEHHDDFIKYSSGQSNVCEYFKNILKNNNINFIEEFTPFWPESGYRLDVAFPDEKIGIEINGSQHYNSNGELNENTLKKQHFFENKGWKIIQIYYKDVYKENITSIKEILNLPIRSKEYIKEDIDTRYLAKKKKEQLLEEKRNNRLILLEEQNNKRKEIIRNLIENSNIDFSKSGWTEKCKDYLKSRNEFFSNHIFQNIRKYFPDFLKRSDVFKRKGSIY